MKKLKAIVGIILVMILMSIVCSCRSIQYVPVETIRTEYKDRIIRDTSATTEVVNVKDSIRYKDSIVQVVDENGNVLRTEVYKWRDRFHESNYLLKHLQQRYDSLSHLKQDSIQVPYPVEIEKKLSWWDGIKIELGGWAFGMILIVGLVLAWKFFRRKTKIL